MKASHLLLNFFTYTYFIFYGSAVTAATVTQIAPITPQSGAGNPVPDEVFTFTGFDSGSGTLNSVEFSYSIDIHLYADCVAYYDCNTIGYSSFSGQGLANELYLTNNTGWVELGYSTTPQLIDQIFTLSGSYTFTNETPFIDVADFDIWLDVSSLFYGGGASIAYASPAGGNVTLIYNYSAVPVPAAFWLFASGLLGLIGVTRRRTAI